MKLLIKGFQERDIHEKRGREGRKAKERKERE
jgi:hypothetical protein